MPSERFHKYVELCKQHHATSKTFSGNGMLKHRKELLGLALECHAESALDYGCGKANAYQKVSEVDGKTFEQALGFEVQKYDPAVPDFDQKPDGQFDVSWCTDALEHIPEEDIAYVLEDIAAHTRKAVFLTIATYPAKKLLPNGENAHVTIKPAQWWTAQIMEMRKAHPELRVEYQIA